MAALLAATACSPGKPDGPTPIQVIVRSPLPCELAGCVGDGVDTNTGAYTFATDDLLFPTGLYGLALTRTYRSDRASVGWFGAGWSTIYETTVNVDATGVEVTAPAGLAPQWSPEAPEEWAVSGDLRAEAHGDSVDLVWPTGERWTFDGSTGALQALSSPYGQRVTIERSGDRPIALRSSQGPSITFERENDRIVRATTDDGREVAYRYEGARLIGSSAPGLQLAHSYNADGRMLQVKAPAGTTSIDYANGRVARQVLASGRAVDLRYDTRTTTVTDGETSVFVHDAQGRLRQVNRGDDDVLVRKLDALGRITEETQYALPQREPAHTLVRSYRGPQLVSETRDGVVVEFSYDKLGRVERATAPDGAVSFEYRDQDPLPSAAEAPSTGRTQFEYHDGFVTRVRDASDVVTTVERDALGNPIAQGIGDRAPWRSTFDAEGNVVRTTAPGGRTWNTQWNPRRQLRAETDPLGRSTTYAYDDAGHLVAQRAPDDRVALFEYRNGRLVKETSTDGLVTSYEYGQRGELTSTILPGSTTWRSNTEHRSDGSSVVTVNAPDGARTVSTIDSAGRETERVTYGEADVVVEKRTWTFDSGRTAAAKTVRGKSTDVAIYGYDRYGRLVRLSEMLDDRQLAETSYAYARGRVASTSDRSTTVAYAYDAAGRLVRTSTGGNETWAAEYTAGRITQLTDATGTRTIDYDLDGRATTFRSGGAVTRWTYDDADRPTTRAVGDAVAQFAWSAADELMSYRSSDGSIWSWTYDRAGRMVTATEPNGGTTSWAFPNGRLTSQKSNGKTVEYEYDMRGRLTKVGDSSYTYDATDLPVVVKADGAEERWSYDAAGRVTAVVSGSDTFNVVYDRDGRIGAISGDGKGLSATWDGGLSIDVTGRDPLRVRVAEDRLSSVRWDDDTEVNLDWKTDDGGYRLTIGQKGHDDQIYEVQDGRLMSYSTAKTSIGGTTQSSGYLGRLDVQVDRAHGSATFDSFGRPAQVTGANGATATLSYNQDGRISAVATTTENRPTLATYGADGKMKVDGSDKELIQSLFQDNGRLRAPLPSSLPNPRSAELGAANAHAAELMSLPSLDVPEPNPLADVDAARAANTPTPIAPIGVRDLKKVAEKIAVAEISRLAPTVKVNGELAVRLPIVDPVSADVAAYNPFVDAVPSGLITGLVAKRAGDGGSLFDRAKGSLEDIAGGTLAFGTKVFRFIADNPIARFVLGAGAWVAASLACGSTGAACVALAAVAVFTAAAETGDLAISTANQLTRSCPSAGLARCGLLLAVGASSLVLAAATAKVGIALADTFFARRAYAAALESGVNVAQASGNVGTAKSELLAALRFERIVDREVPVCAEGTCARLDLVSRDLAGRNRFIEVKNGAGARLTPNQQVVYPLLRTSGGYFPNGLAGASPQVLVAHVQIQHWGSVARLTL